MGVDKNLNKLKSGHWWSLSVAWLVGVAIGWHQYFEHRNELAIKSAEMARVKAIFESLEQQPKLGTEVVANADRLKQHVQALSHQRFTPAELKQARGYLSHQLIKCGYDPIQRGFSGGINVEVSHKADLHTADTIIVGAHYDTVHGTPGADDNASGVAGLIELACIARQRRFDAHLRFVFFDGEERGRAGSRAYLMNPDRRQNVVGALVLEMIGATCHKPGCQMWPGAVPGWMRRADGKFIAAVGDIGDSRLLASVAMATGPDRPDIHAVPVLRAGIDFPDSRRSDHASFWDVGISAVMLTDTADFRTPHYHSQTDTTEHLDFQFMRGVVDIALDAIIFFDAKLKRSREARSSIFDGGL